MIEPLRQLSTQSSVSLQKNISKERRLQLLHSFGCAISKTLDKFWTGVLFFTPFFENFFGFADSRLIPCSIINCLFALASGFIFGGLIAIVFVGVKNVFTKLKKQRKKQQLARNLQMDQSRLKMNGILGKPYALIPVGLAEQKALLYSEVELSH